MRTGGSAARCKRDTDRAAEAVREAMSPDPYTVPPDAPIEEVAARMAERKIGSAVVLDRGSVIGVFTTVDALRALAALAGRRRKRARASECPDAALRKPCAG